MRHASSSSNALARGQQPNELTDSLKACHGILSQTYTVNAASLTDVPLDLRARLSNPMVALQTSGDGACGVHALFGIPCETGVLHHADARGLAAALLGPSKACLLDEGVSADKLAGIETSTWNEFAAPQLQRDRAGEQSAESRTFWKALLANNGDLAEEACQTAAANQAAKVARQVARAKLVETCLTCFLWNANLYS